MPRFLISRDSRVGSTAAAQQINLMPAGDFHPILLTAAGEGMTRVRRPTGFRLPLAAIHPCSARVHTLHASIHGIHPSEEGVTWTCLLTSVHPPRINY